MAKSVNEKYMDATESAFYDTRFDPYIFAITLSHQPPATQMQFFRLATAYVDALAKCGDSGYAPFGMSEIVRAAQEMRDVINDYFPVDDSATVILNGVEWVQI